MIRTLFLLTLAFPLSLGHAATVALDGSNSNPAVGGSVVVTFRLTSAPASTTWNQYLTFDRTKLALTAQAAGSDGSFVPDSRSLADINASGEVRAAGYVVGSSISGNLTVGRFTFRALASGSTSIATAGRASDRLSANVLVGVAPGRTLTVPQSAAQVALTIGGSPVVRVIRMRLLSAGTDFSITPSAGSVGIQGDYQVFGGLDPATTYTVSVIPAPAGKG